jgi:hypothetical protein
MPSRPNVQPAAVHAGPGLSTVSHHRHVRPVDAGIQQPDRVSTGGDRGRRAPAFFQPPKTYELMIETLGRDGTIDLDLVSQAGTGWHQNL